MRNVEFFFPTPNTISRIRIGVIASLKKRYRRRQISMALDCLKEVKPLFIWISMECMREIWDELDISIIQKCWIMTGVIDKLVQFNYNLVVPNRDQRDFDRF